MKLLFENWREYLSEITRYEKETGKKSFGKFDITRFVTNTEPVKYAFTMVSQEKVGLNPKTKYNTPAGVYFYPLNQEYYNNLVEDKLPFASDKPFVGVVKLKDINTDKWLKFINKGNSFQTPARVLEAMKKVGIYDDTVTLSSLMETNDGIDYLPGDLELDLNHWGFNNDAKIFDLTWWKTTQMDKSTFKWNKLLRDLGYIGVYDANNSVIHPKEPSQAVALSPKAYQVVAFYSTADIRKADFPSSEIRRIELAGKSGLPKEIYQKLAAGGDDQVIIALLSNSSVSEAIFEFLLNNNPSVRVKIELANNPRTSIDILRKLSKRVARARPVIITGWGQSMSEGAVRKAVAQNPNTPEDILITLASDNGIMVREAVAKNHKTPAKALRKIVEHPDLNMMIIDKVVNNPNIPEDLWGLIIKHDNITYDGHVSLVRSRRIPPEILKELASQNIFDIGGVGVHRGNLNVEIAKNPRTPPETLKDFSKLTDYAIRKEVARNPNTPPEVLEKMMGEHSLSLYVLGNPKVPLKILTDTIKSPEAGKNAKRTAWHIIKRKFGQGEISAKQMAKPPFTDEDFQKAIAAIGGVWVPSFRPGSRSIRMERRGAGSRPIRILFGNKKS